MPLFKFLKYTVFINLFAAETTIHEKSSQSVPPINVQCADTIKDRFLIITAPQKLPRKFTLLPKVASLLGDPAHVHLTKWV